MITWINIWIILTILTFIGMLIYLPVKDAINVKKGKLSKTDAIDLFTSVLVSVFCTFIVATFGLVATAYAPFTNDTQKHGVFEYNTEYITENIVYNERFSDGHSVFIGDKEFVCDEAKIEDVENFKIMKSDYVWKNGIHKFFYNHFFFKAETKYQLIIPEKYIKDGLIEYDK